MNALEQQLNFQPNDLTVEEINKPQEGIADFFSEQPLHTVRDKLWSFYQAWVNQNADKVDPETIKDFLFFYSRMIDLTDLAYIIGHQAEWKELEGQDEKN